MDPFSFAVMAVAQIGIGFLFPSSGPRMKDLKIAASTYGAVIPEVYGTVRVAANMIWSDKIREHKKKKRVGLKSYKYYTYTCTFAMGVCRGPVTAVRRIWANHKLIYDAEGGPIAIKKKFKIKTYLGDEEQEPAAAIEQIVGEGNAPAYRGLCYLLFEDMALEDFGNSIPQITVEVFGEGDANPIGRYNRFTQSISTFTGQMVYSSEHDVAFVWSRANPDYVRRLRVSSMTEEAFFSEAQTGMEVSTLLGISPSSGFLLALANFAEGGPGSSPMVMLDPTSLIPVGGLGQFASDFPILPASTDIGTFTVGGDRQEYLGFTSALGNWRVVPTYPLPFFHQGSSVSLGQRMNGVSGYSFMVGTRGAPNPTFFTWEGGSSFGNYVPYLRLRKFTMVGGAWSGEVVYDHPNPTPPGQSGVYDIGFQVWGLHYDMADRGVLVMWTETQYSRPYLAKISADGEMVWRISLSGAGSLDLWDNRPAAVNGELWWGVGSTRLYRLNTVTGEWITQWRDPWADYDSPDDIPASVVNRPMEEYDGVPLESATSISLTGGYTYYDSANEALVGIGPSGGAYPAWIVRPALSPQANVTLAGLVSRVLRRAGMSADLFDVSDLEQQPILGYGWASASDVKSILDQLRMVYLFDLFERDGKLVGLMRTTSSNEARPGRPVRNIPQALLGSNGDGSGMDYWTETRIQEADLPSRVSLSYMNWEHDFETSTAVSKRVADPVPAMFSRQQIAMEMGVVMTPTEAKNQTNKILWAQWGERTKHATRLPWTYLDLDPADVIAVSMNDGRRYRDRIHMLEFGADLGIGAETVTQDEAAYVSNAVADGGSAPPPILTQPPRPARPFIFNTPLLRDQDDTGGAFSLYYTGVGHSAPDDFTGAGLWHSVNDQGYDLLYTTDQDVEWGTVAGVTPPPRHGSFALDWETKITIWPVINWFELESITDDELWAGGNLCVVGQEVMQFRDAVQNPDGSWTISNLLRGRRGTEYACATHVFGETFCFLATSTIEGEGETLDAKGQARWFIALGEGKDIDTAPSLKLTYIPRDLMPYAPKDIRRTISGGSIVLDWKRRTRMGGNMQDGTESVPLHETAERYEVYVLSAPYAGDLSRGDEVPIETVVYQAETTASSVTIPVGEIMLPRPPVAGVPSAPSSFDVNLDTLHVLIYQVSSAVGRGFPGVRSIEPWQDF